MLALFGGMYKHFNIIYLKENSKLYEVTLVVLFLPGCMFVEEEFPQCSVNGIKHTE